MKEDREKGEEEKDKYLCLKNAIDKHGLHMRIFLCQFWACVYFAASLENCCIFLLF